MAEILLSIPNGYAGVSKVVHQLTSHCSQNTVAAVLVALAVMAVQAALGELEELLLVVVLAVQAVL